MGKGIDEIIKSRQAPGAKVFKERWVHNLSQWPTLVSSETEHKALMKQADAIDIGDDGLKEGKEKRRDLRADAERKKEQ